PAPHALHERLAPDRLARGPLALEQPLDLGLRRDARVVGAEDPLRALAAHARVPDQRVLDRAVERVPHVQRAGDVRRRDRDRVVLRGGPGRFRVEATGFEPAREDPRLRLPRVVAGSVLQRMPHRAGSVGATTPRPTSRRYPAGTQIAYTVNWLEPPAAYT